MAILEVSNSSTNRNAVVRSPQISILSPVIIALQLPMVRAEVALLKRLILKPQEVDPLV